MTYSSKVEEEIKRYRQVENVHALPDIFHYCSGKYWLPKFQALGFESVQDFYLKFIQKASRQCPKPTGKAQRANKK